MGTRIIAISTIVAALGLSLNTMAQDEPAKIIGEIADGTPSTPLSKPDLPPVEILKTRTVQLPKRRVTIHKIADPGLPPPKLAGSQEMKEDEGNRNSPTVQLSHELPVKTTSLYIVATEVDKRATFLSWRHKGAMYAAWSNADWKILSGLSGFQKGDKRFVSLLMVNKTSSAYLPADSPYHIPAVLPADPGTLPITSHRET